ncbi:putative lectin-like domain protein [Brevundimonas phage vB_BpoS-Kikimora]|uniref:receptor protein-tyrosine kinase n=1 Tax=Brevundimonas phage vB_BpoS-Kikimora TaxID=2948601 RepID=A0A9E7MS22_9CAUD|nr:putative lectin-like domain protein [Brevundimonas phage vB_BpoS-Kikimora]
MIIPGFYAAARSALAPVLAMGMTLFTFTRLRELRRIPEGCRLIEIKAWGAGGAGPARTDLWGAGGAGGYVNHMFEVTPGEVVAIQVGNGGELGVTGRGGYGGWPDGGNGGRGRGSIASGGGGSTMFWKSGVLSLVAAGGGGGGLYLAGAGRGGIAGGLNASFGGSSAQATGGSPTSGGVPLPEAALIENPAGRGGFLQGGRGYANAIDTVENRAGGGGGGGYYGGGGAYFQDSLYTGHGGGGSSYIVPSDAFHQPPKFASDDVTTVPANITDSDYPGNSIGYGGARGVAGYPGALVIHAYPDDPQPIRLTQEYVNVIAQRAAAAARVTHFNISCVQYRLADSVLTSHQDITIIRSPT